MPNNGQIIVGNNNKRAVAAGVAAALNRGVQAAPRLLAAIQRGRQAGAQRAKQRSNDAPRGRQVMAPVNNGLCSVPGPTYRVSGSGSSVNSRSIVGTSCLGVVTTGTSSGTLPTCGFFSSSNPVVFPDRMQLEAQLFDKYVYKRCTLRFVPQVSTSTSGMVAVAIDRDYMDDLQTGSWAIATSYESVSFGSVWAPHSTSMARDKHEMRTYFTNFGASLEPRECEQFKFYVYTLGCPVNTTLGQVFLDYELELISPVYAPSEIGLPANIQMKFSTGSLTLFATSSSATAPFLPSNSTSLGNIYEVVFQGPAKTGLSFTVGPGGPSYVPTLTGSCRFFMKGVTAGTGFNYDVYLDYPSAYNGTFNCAIYNGAVVATALVDNTQIEYRLLSTTTKSDAQ